MKYMLLLVCTMGYGQAVEVNKAGTDAVNLVNTLLDNACVQVSNASISSEESIGFFNNNQGNFPISEGIVIRSGKAEFSEGRYTGENVSSQVNESGDADLERINNASGQSTLITDVAFLEFDFVPLSSNFNFNFLFASNEYGEWQCVSSDVFAFLLTDLTTGETTNLAVIPETDIPVSVRNIKDDAYNASCESDYPGLFGSYEVQDPKRSSVNMRGYTQVMNASADITPGNSYRIRLVIGDSNDGNFDSAIFLEAGSFSANVDLGQDRDFCQGEEFQLTTELNTELYAHTWTYDGQEIPGETSNSLMVRKSGIYGVQVTKSGTSCLVTDEIVFSDLQVEPPKDLMVCYNEEGTYTYDLTRNNETALGINDEEYDLLYYTSYTRLANELPIPEANLKEFRSSGNQKILVKVVNKFTGSSCDAVYDFQLLVNDPVVANKPQPIEACIIPGKKVYVDLTEVHSQILGEEDSAAFAVSYFSQREDAENNENEINTPTAYAVAAGKTSETLWVRVEDTTMPECFTSLSFEVILNDPPPVDELENVVECQQYILPELVHGNYFTGSGGTGTPLFAGDVIEKTGTYFIFNGPDENGCTNESSFRVTIIEDYRIGEKYCGQFIVPTPPEGGFYTAPGGPEGDGEEILPGTVITQSGPVYYYAEIEETLCRDERFNIIILPLPPVDQPADVVTCGSYRLPALEHGNYYTESGGEGHKLNAGEIISFSQTLFVYNDNGTCSAEHSFRVNITPSFENVTACGSFELPAVEVGGYFSQPAGQGEEIPAGSFITSSRRIYYHAETSAASNCTDQMSFQVNINPIPEVDRLEDVLICEGEVFVLPEIINGDYFTETSRGGVQLSAGAVIDTTTTIYINNLANSCTNESSFLVEVRELPPVENFTDIYTCAAYELPVLRYGKYFTQPGGNGTEIEGGEIITSTRTFYVYNSWEDMTSCYDENAFTVYVEGIDVGEFEDVSVCDYYELPKLPKGGDYFTESDGNGTKLKAGDRITETKRIYVYSSNGTRFICTDEESFLVTVSYTPELPPLDYVESCGSYRLPDLSQEEYNISYYRSPGGESEITPAERTISEPGIYTVYVYASAKNNPDCVAEGQFDVRIYPLLDLPIEGATVCRDPETGAVVSQAYLDSGLDPQEFEVNWYFEDELVHTGPDYQTSEPGDYTIETVKLKPEAGASCNYKPASVRVEESALPVISATVTEPFEDVAVVTVSVEKGFGRYEYQLDNGAFQESNQFYDVGSGSHTLRVRGVTGNCGDAVVEVVVLKFPPFFTPNNDGHNDIWNIPDLRDHPEARIHIFDRYGKLLKTFPPNEGWDGFFHGRPMPSDDYWFRVSFEHEGVPTEFKSHFTLLR